MLPGTTVWTSSIGTSPSCRLEGAAGVGIVEEVGPEVRNLDVGDRVVVPFPIACGSCNACAAELYSLCENSNPNAGMAEMMFGFPTSGIFATPT